MRCGECGWPGGRCGEPCSTCGKPVADPYGPEEPETAPAPSAEPEEAERPPGWGGELEPEQPAQIIELPMYRRMMLSSRTEREFGMFAAMRDP